MPFTAVSVSSTNEGTLDSPKPSIVTLTRRTRAKFDHLILLSSTPERSRAPSIPLFALQDALERFDLWAGNIGATQDAGRRASLDFRLNDTPEIKEQICSLLSDMIEALDDLEEIITGERENRTKDSVNVELGRGQDDLPLSVELGPVDEAKDILGVVLDCLRNLFRISIVIRKASPRDRFSKALQRSGRLRIRLGHAITQRRQFLHYCSDHRDRLGGLDIENDPLNAVVESGRPAATTIQASTKASTLDVTRLEFEPSWKDEGDDGLSYTTVASSMGISEGNPLQLPTLHDVCQDQKEFECPFCRTIQSFKREKQWRRHAFTDLKPYMCSFGEGECDLELFGDRKTWFSHELQHHRRQWSCIFCTKEPFFSIDQIKSHIQSKHVKLSAKQFLDMAEVCQRPLEQIPAADCPFCDKWGHQLSTEHSADFESLADTSAKARVLVDSNRFQRHVARHMEQLALFAVPR
ncbi:hypothetical protein BU16DRAFT_458300, partial [Lophium mytilinum]